MPEELHQARAELIHVCPGCGEQYEDDCLAERADWHMLRVKASIVEWAGKGTTLLIGGLCACHYHAFLKGLNTGIDLNHVMVACLVLLGAIIWWAFPKGKK